jgi:hypothetical protein
MNRNGMYTANTVVLSILEDTIAVVVGAGVIVVVVVIDIFFFK